MDRVEFLSTNIDLNSLKLNNVQHKLFEYGRGFYYTGSAFLSRTAEDILLPEYVPAPELLAFPGSL